MSIIYIIHVKIHTHLHICSDVHYNMGLSPPKPLSLQYICAHAHAQTQRKTERKFRSNRRKCVTDRGRRWHTERLNPAVSLYVDFLCSQLSQGPFPVSDTGRGQGWSLLWDETDLSCQHDSCYCNICSDFYILVLLFWLQRWNWYCREKMNKNNLQLMMIIILFLLSSPSSHLYWFDTISWRSVRLLRPV